MISSGPASRIKTVGEGWDQGSHQSVVVKHTTSPAKTPTAVGALIDYIACAYQTTSRPALQLDLVDEFGAPVSFADRRAQLRNWTLLSEEENRKPDRTGSSPDDMQRYQAHHLIWSFNADEAELSDDVAETLMRAVARDFVFENFAQEGRPVLWTVHRDKPGRPHVHMVVSGFDEDNRSLGLDKSRRKLDDFCADLARLGRVYDLPMSFTRREDRERVRAQVYQGLVPLRSNVKRVAYEKSTELWDRAPGWFQSHGAELLERWRSLSEGVEIRAKNYRRHGDSLDALGEMLEGVYAEPRKAAESICRMVNGTGRNNEVALAAWYLVNRPETFGYPAGRFGKPSVRRAIAKQVRKQRNWPRLPVLVGEDVRADFIAHRRKRKASKDIWLIGKSMADLAAQAAQSGINPLTVNTIRSVASEAQEAAERTASRQPRVKRRGWRALLPNDGLSLLKRDR